MTPLPFYKTLAARGAAVALVDEAGRKTSYRQLNTAAGAFAKRLGAGRKLVFLEAVNTPASIAAYLGCLIGGHPVYLFQVQDDALGRLAGLYRPNVVVTHADGEAAIDHRHDDLLDLHPDLRVLLSTSGSTGSPKFVKLSETNIASNAASIAEYLEITPQDRAATALKFNYSYGMSVINSALAAGASLLLTDRSVVEPEFWASFREHGATSFAGVPHTFETLARLDGLLADTPSLRYATQAGGRLPPELVTRFAETSRRDGWRFYVMYGQTEASPRISYLPPDMAQAYPGSIGRAIPGGTIRIVDIDGSAITEAGRPGELVYAGPNVMMGYAEGWAQLSTDEAPGQLATGDLAQWNAGGLVEIVGRASRFVKPFGLRVNLDEVEAYVRRTAPDAVCTGTDDFILAALPATQGAVDEDALIADLSRVYKLPAFVFRLVRVADIPRLPNDKVAYRALIDAAEATHKETGPGLGPVERLLAKWPKLGTELWLSRNQILTLLVSGLWHGAAWTFVSWGGLHGLLLVLQRQVGARIKATYKASRTLNLISIPVQIAIVFTMVAISRVLFRADSLKDAGTVFGNILMGPYNWKGLDGKATLAVCFLIILAVVLTEAMVELGIWRRYFARRRMLRTAAALAVFLVTLLLGDFSGGRFIYVRF